MHAGAGGHGCISFLREKFVAQGPANGGDGGGGGSVYIQAVRGETSLHKLARRGIVRAGRGKNGRGKGMGGERGEDILLTVPIGTVVKELSRVDPITEEEEQAKLRRGGSVGPNSSDPPPDPKEKWILHPSSLPSEYTTSEFPPLPRSRRTHLASTQPASPISLDLSAPQSSPTLLAAGAPGGHGNPHFVSRANPRPRFATRGSPAISVSLSLELKLLADVGLVGAPNAGKSTLLRALSASRARVGDWAFTTLTPNIGTVVLDDYRGRAGSSAANDGRTHFTVADIPGLIEDAHLDKGLGLGFLRHIERARVLAFVVDLSAGGAVEAVKSLWRELHEYEALREREEKREEAERVVEWKPGLLPEGSGGEERIVIGGEGADAVRNVVEIESGRGGGISEKAWFVVATKADVEGTRDEFEKLKAWLEEGGRPHVVERKESERGQRKESAGWMGKIGVIPVSAITPPAPVEGQEGREGVTGGGGVERAVEWITGLLRK